MQSVFPLRGVQKEDEYTNILAYNFGRSPLLTAITQKLFEVVNIFYGRSKRPFER